MKTVQSKDAQTYVSQVNALGKLKREWYMRGVRDERSRVRNLIEGYRLKIVEHTYVLQLGDVFIPTEKVGEIVAPDVV